MRLFSPKETFEHKSDIEREKRDELNAIEKEIKERTQHLSTFEANEEKRKALKDYQDFVQMIGEKKRNLLQETALLEQKHRDNDKPLQDISLLVNEKQQELEAIKMKITESKDFESKLMIRELELTEKEERMKSKEKEIEIRETQIVVERETLNKEKAHLESQQITLRQAFEEYKKLTNK